MSITVLSEEVFGILNNQQGRVTSEGLATPLVARERAVRRRVPIDGDEHVPHIFMES